MLISLFIGWVDFEYTYIFVTFTPNPDTQQQCAPFGIVDDSLPFEGNEQFSVTFARNTHYYQLPEGVQLGSITTTIVTIIDDDGKRSHCMHEIVYR